MDLSLNLQENLSIFFSKSCKYTVNSALHPIVTKEDSKIFQPKSAKCNSLCASKEERQRT